ncbi:dynein regulatory complex subunit 6-like isoform X2 [Ischnura elegans]|nr:dynein regulatory complex subunit 6-like isoform X2 [Ischnura elegans]
MRLPAEDILYAEIFTYLSVMDLQNMKLAMPESDYLINVYLGQLKDVEWEDVPEEQRMNIAYYTRSLKTVDLSRAPLVRGAFVTLVLQMNETITHLNLRECPALTIEAVKPITQLKSLSALSVRGNKWVTNRFIFLLTGSLDSKQLKKVDFSLCLVTDIAMEEFLLKFVGLEEIDLESCTLISDRTPNNIAVACTELVHLNVAWCPYIGDSSLRFVIRGCQKLKRLRIYGCPKVTKEFKDSLPKAILYH